MKLLLPTNEESWSTDASDTTISDEHTRVTAPSASTASKPSAFTPLANVMPENEGEAEVANS
jgi:hypothetical protein